jgi:hypothetical protein
MGVSVAFLFEHELKSRGIAFTLDPKTGRYSVHAGMPTLVSLDSIAREYSIDRDPDGVSRFVEAILGGGVIPDWEIARKSILFALEPNDYAESSDLRLSISRKVDRLPILVDERLGTWRWIDQHMVEEWRVRVDDIVDAATCGVVSAMISSKLERDDIEGVSLGYFETALPLKSPLLLAPNLKDVVGSILGWPLHAVVPDQDFIYVWPAGAEQFYERIGAVVVREYSAAPHPVTTELFKIGDDGIKAVGAFS